MRDTTQPDVPASAAAAPRGCRPAPRAARLAACLVALAATLPAVAADVAAGRTKAAQCAVCHGPLGIGATPDAPNLAGQPAMYVDAQLRAYRNGTRKHEVMAVMAKPLTDAEIANLAAWYASIRIEAKAPD